MDFLHPSQGKIDLQIVQLKPKTGWPEFNTKIPTIQQTDRVSLECSGLEDVHNPYFGLGIFKEAMLT